MSVTDRGRSNVAGLDDASLIAAIQSGDAVIYRYVFEDVYPTLVHFALHIVHSRDSAEDIVQTVLLDIWIHRATWRPAGALRAYLFRAVRNHALNLLRHDHVVERAEATADTDAPYGLGEGPLPPDAAVESSARVEAVAAAVRQLPERQRTAVILHWYEGLSPAAVAAAMDISRQVAEKLLRKAEAKLRVALYDTWAE